MAALTIVVDIKAKVFPPAFRRGIFCIDAFVEIHCSGKLQELMYLELKMDPVASRDDAGLEYEKIKYCLE